MCQLSLCDTVIIASSMTSCSGTCESFNLMRTYEFPLFLTFKMWIFNIFKRGRETLLVDYFSLLVKELTAPLRVMPKVWFVPFRFVWFTSCYFYIEIFNVQTEYIVNSCLNVKSISGWCCTKGFGVDEWLFFKSRGFQHYRGAVQIPGWFISDATLRQFLKIP